VPSVNGFHLVSDMPSPSPAQLGSSAVKQLMTAGHVTSTPRILSRQSDDGEVSGTPFRIAELSKREKVARKLANTAIQSLKGKDLRKAAGSNRAIRGNMDPPAATPRRLPGNLTPAARRLLDRTAGSTMLSNQRFQTTSRGHRHGDEPPSKDLSKLVWSPSPIAKRIT
jgi:protein DGCR14